MKLNRGPGNRRLFNKEVNMALQMTLEEHGKRNKCQGFYSDQSGLCGLRYGGFIHWFRLAPNDCIEETGTTLTPEGATYVRFEQSKRGPSQKP